MAPHVDNPTLENRGNYTTTWDATSGFTEASDGRRIHDLRHTFATLALARGVDLATVSKWLGHGSVSITDRYMHYLGTQADVAGLALLNGGGGAPGERDDESEVAL